MKRSLALGLAILLLTFIPLTTLAAPTTIRLLHVNDFHGFANPITPPGATEPLGGAAWLAARITSLRGEKPSLLLSAGDMIQGDNWANLFQGESSIALMNLLGFDAMVVGNHEFDFGQKILKKRIGEAHFPVLGANVAGLEPLKPYVIREVGGVRVAIVGLVTDDTPVTSHPANTVGLVFSSPLATATSLVAELRGKADLIVLLTHIGHGADRALAERLPGPLVIIGGHSHTKVDKPVRIGNNLVVQAWEHGKALGVLDITIDGGKLVSAEGRLEEIRAIPGMGDQETARLVESYNARFAGLLNEKAGEAAVDLVADQGRRKETNFGNLVADIIRQSAGADAALINGGSIRTGIKRGAILARDIYAALPFNNYIVAFRLTGKELRQALEHGVSAVESGAGRFPQVSGLSFTYSASAPPGSRVRAVRVAGEPLDDTRDYRVATLDFLAAGGDGYRAFGDALRRSDDFTVTGGVLQGKNLVFSDPGHWLRDLVIDYLRLKGSVAPAIEGRIRALP